MIAHVITWSARNRGTVFILAAVLALWGAWSARQAPLDAIPDLSDTQVIVFTEWMGRSPDLVEDQVTWPLSSALLSTPQVKAVRGQSMFGMSFVYVLFEDGTVPEDARLGVTEILTRVGPRLPAGARPTLGPDATGVGWVYQYAVVDDSHALSPAELRQLQETVIKPALQSTPGVAEIATVGGHVEQIEVSVDPARLLAHGATFEQVSAAVVRANVPAGGGSIEVAGHELMIRSRAEARSLDDLMDAPIPGARGAPASVAPRSVTGSAAAASTTDAMGAMGSTSSNVGVSTSGTATAGGATHVVRVRDVADVQRAPAPRRGVADFDGLGETTGGIVVARQGGNALDVITGVKERLEGVQNALPPGVRVVPVYDRSTLIRGAVGTLAETLVEELIVVSLIIMLFLGHVRTALVPVLVLPIAVLAAFIPMAAQGITVNIMSLAGIAVAVGAMVDSAILTVENIHVHLAKWERDGRPGARIDALIAAMTEVGPSAFFSLLVIGVSFLPVFALEAAEGRLFGPLAWTKTWSMLFAAVLAVTLAPALAVTFITTRGKTEEEDWLSRVLTRLYAPVVRRLVRLRWLVVAAAAAFVAATVPVSRIDLVGVHAAHERGQPPVHAGLAPRHLGSRGRSDSPSDGRGASQGARGGRCLREDGALRFSDRPCAADHGGDGDRAQATRGMAPWPDVGRPRRRTRRSHDHARATQPVVVPGSNANRDVVDRHPEPAGNQGPGADPGRRGGRDNQAREAARRRAGDPERVRRPIRWGVHPRCGHETRRGRRTWRVCGRHREHARRRACGTARR
jgi:Cu(I)/Ag(I) efflux system membrane protein CusA/SilA